MAYHGIVNDQTGAIDEDALCVEALALAARHKDYFQSRGENLDWSNSDFYAAAYADVRNNAEYESRKIINPQPAEMHPDIAARLSRGGIQREI